MTTRIVCALTLAGCALQWWVGQASPLELVLLLVTHTAAEGLFVLWGIWWIRFGARQQARINAWFAERE